MLVWHYHYKVYLLQKKNTLLIVQVSDIYTKQQINEIRISLQMYDKITVCCSFFKLRGGVNRRPYQHAPPTL
jgi:hypothetical protein